MALIAEFHVLQNFAPANLNRDDTGAPKDAVFGGVRRARISSQCLKRAIRKQFEADRLLPAEALGARSKRIVKAVSELLRSCHQRAEADEHLSAVVGMALQQLGLGIKKDKGATWGETEFLLFVGRGELRALAECIHTHFESLAQVAATSAAEEATSAEGEKAKAARGKKAKADKAVLSRDVVSALNACIGHARAVDVALFGRMLADRKDFNVDAAAQVAHAISTHRVDRDVDFFTAVDDFAPLDEAVSAMLGTVEFNSSCFYRYAVVNLDLLRNHLDGDTALTRRALDAFAHAFATAVPTGKQNTFAAHNPPDFVAVAVRHGAPLNLANAFEKPVHPGEAAGGITAGSVARLRQRWATYARAYGVEEDALQALDLTVQSAVPASLRELVDAALQRYDTQSAKQP